MRPVYVLIFLALSTSVLAQQREIEFLYDSTRVKVFFSPHINTSLNSSRFTLTMDSIGGQSDFYAWDVDFDVFLKLQDTVASSSCKFVYPVYVEWDTIVQGKILSYSVEPVSIKPADSLISLVRDLNNLHQILEDSLINSDSALAKVREIYTRICSLKKSSYNWSLYKKWISTSLTDIALDLKKYDSPGSYVRILREAMLINPDDPRPALLLSDFYADNKQYEEAYYFLKICAKNVSAYDYSLAAQTARTVFKFFVNSAHQSKDRHAACRYISYADTLRTLYGIQDQGFDSLYAYITLQTARDLQKHIDSAINEYDMNRALDLLEKYLDFAYRHKARQYDDTVSSMLDEFVQHLLDWQSHTSNYRKTNDLLYRFIGLCEKYTLCQKRNLDDKLKQLYYDNFVLWAQLYGKNNDPFLARRILDSAEQWRSKNYLDTSFAWKKLSADLDSQILAVRIDSVKQLVASGQLSPAFRLVKSLEARQNNDTVDSLYQSVLRMWILQEIKQAGSGNKDILQLDRQILRYGLHYDSLVLSAYGKFIMPADSSCRMAHLSFFRLFVYADSLLEQKQFLKLRDTLESFVRNSGGCKIDADTIDGLIAKYNDAVIYQLKLDSFYLLLNGGDYPAAYGKIIQAVEYYGHKQIGQYGLPSPDLAKIIGGSRPDFIEYAAQRLIQTDSITLAYNLLDTLRLKGTPPDKVKHLQAALGYRLALRDFTLHPYDSVLRSAEKYIAPEPLWYRYLFVSYIKQRRKMKVFRF